MRFREKVQEVLYGEITMEWVLLVSVFLFGLGIGVVVGLLKARSSGKGESATVGNVTMAVRQKEMQAIMSGGGIWKWLRNLISK